MLRFVDLQNRVLQWMDEATTSAVQPTTETLGKSAINAVHRRLCLSRTWAFMLWPREESFTTTVGVRSATLNPNVGKLLYVWSPTQRLFLPTVPLRQWEAVGVDRSAQADFRGAVFGAFWPVASQPATASVLTIVSTSVADTGASYTVIVRGIDATGDVITETLTASGTSPVTGATTFTAILNVTKVGTWAGTMTLKDAVPTTLLTLTSAQYGKQYPTLEFVETPASAMTYTYSFTRVPTTLVEDNDIPEIPYPFSEVLVYDALLDLIAYRTDVGEKHVALWSARRQELLKQLDEAQDEAITGSTVRTVRDVDGQRGRPAVFLS